MRKELMIVPPEFNLQNARTAFLITDPRLFSIAAAAGILGKKKGTIFNTASVHLLSGVSEPVVIAGPAFGGAAAAVAAETLIANGIRVLIQIGSCGSLCEEHRIGDVIVPDEVLAMDGVALVYGNGRTRFSTSSRLYDLLREAIGFSAGSCTIASTDALFLETPTMLQEMKSIGAEGVEMEFAAVVSVGELRGIETAGALIVSDRPFEIEPAEGFSRKEFKKRCGEFLQTVTGARSLRQSG